MKLVIEGDEGRKSIVPVHDEMTIGRDDGNTVRLPDRNISRRHARLFQRDGRLLIEDLGSFNGVRVNGRKIGAATPVDEGDLIELGDYELSVEGKLEESSSSQDAVPVAHAVSHPEPANGTAKAILGTADVAPVPAVGLRDLDPAETPRLVGLSGPVRGKEFHLTRTEVKFGRGGENDLAVDHQSVSRAHARFLLADGHWKVVDNQSANGIRINGDDYAVGNLSPGDTLELGHLKFRFCGPGEKFSLPAADAPSLERPDEAEAIADEDPAAVDARASSGVRVAALAVVLLTALATGSWIFGRRGASHERPRHGETAPFAIAPTAAEPAAVEAPRPARTDRAATSRATSDRAATNRAAAPNASAASERPAAAATAANAARPAPNVARPAADDAAARPSPTANPSPLPVETKEAQAKRLAATSNEKLNAHDFEGAVSDAQAALDLAPEGRDTLCTAYHSLGYGYSYLNDNRSAKKYLQQFKPCCADFGEATCAQVEEFLAR